MQWRPVLKDFENLSRKRENEKNKYKKIIGAALQHAGSIITFIFIYEVYGLWDIK